MRPMTQPYALLDAGGGRRLERFGEHLVDRPAPSATDAARATERWPAADLLFERTDAGRWVRGGAVPPWNVELHGLTLELRAAAGGQVGLFPEHAALWGWIRDAVRRATPDADGPPEVLSLFAYTGGASLAAASAGARVAHVDAAKGAVAWARRNAALSGLADSPIRWLVDDAWTFVTRESRRGRRYHGLIVDPPSYGHGPSGRDWRIERDLQPFLSDLAALTGEEPGFVLLTAHTPSLGPERLGDLLGSAFGVDPEVGPLELRAESGAVLRLGAVARWVRP